MQNSYSSLEEISSLESFVITSHISSYHHKMMYGLPKNFKKIVKNDSNEAFKINAKAYHSSVTGKFLTHRSSALFDDIVDHPEKLKIDSQFLQTLKSLKLYPNDIFPEWNQHIEIYNILRILQSSLLLAHLLPCWLKALMCLNNKVLNSH